MLIGLLVLGFLMVLILFGMTQRVFDKMRLSTTVAIIILLAMAIGIIAPSIWIGNRFAMNVGGFIVPFALAVYFLVRLGISADFWRAIISIVATTLAILGIRMWVPQSTTWLTILSIVLIGIASGGLSYIIGRSRRGAFVSAVMGITLAEIVYFLIAYFGLGWDVTLALGYGSMFDTIVLGSTIAVALAEILGTMRERTMSVNRSKLQYEAGEEFTLDERDYEEYFRD